MACHLNCTAKNGLVAVMLLFAECFVASVSNADTNYMCLLTNWVPSSMFGTNYVIQHSIDQKAYRYIEMVVKDDTNHISIGVQMFFAPSASAATNGLIEAWRNCSAPGHGVFGNHIGDWCLISGETNNYERATFIRNNVYIDIKLNQNRRTYIDNVAHMIDDDLVRWSNLRLEK